MRKRNSTQKIKQYFCKRDLPVTHYLYKPLNRDYDFQFETFRDHVGFSHATESGFIIITYCSIQHLAYSENI